MPSLEQRRGDFSALLQAGSQYQIYDPATTESAAGGRFRRMPLAGNRIPASRLHPIAVKIVSFWPEPNRTGTPDGRQNYYRSRPEDNDNRSLIGRVDHNFHENHRMFWHLTNNQFDYRAQNMPTIAQGDITDQTGYGMVLDDVYVFNPRLLLNVRYGITYQNPRALRYSQGFDLLSLGFPSSLVDQIRGKNSPAGIAFPLVVVDGSAYTNLGADGGNSRSIYYQTFAGTVTKLSGGHSIRLGGEFRVLRENGYNFGNVSPRLEFSSLWTRGPLDNSAGAPIGQGLAALMLGTPSGGRIDVNASRAQQSTFTAFFVQDDWRVTSRLTFNLGLRYEYEGPTTERFNRSIRGFDFETANPIQERARANYARATIPEVPVTSFRTVGGLTFAGAGGLPRPLWYPDRNNIAPRAGIVYQLTPKTAVRGGYGIFYDLLGIDRQDVNQGGFNQPTNLIPSLDNGLTFIATLGDPFPIGLDIPLGAAGGLRTFVGRGVTYFDQRPANARMQRWSVSIQRELPQRTLLQLAYVGNRGSKLDTQKQQDPIPRQYLSTLPVRDQATIDLLSQQVTNPFSGIPEFAGTGLAGVRTSRAQLLRPYPHFTSIAAALPLGNSSYHSLQVHAERRLSGGFTFQTSWTWSKFIEAQSFLNETDGRLERVISDQDFPHRFVMSVIWELPVGRGKPLLGRAGRMLDYLGGGWQLQGIYEGQSGQALGFGNALFFGNVRDIPLPLSERKAERWFNTEAGFERHPQRQPLYNIQTLSSRFSGVRSDGTNNFDLSMFKNFRLTERLKAQFRFESSNALNHVQFANPDTNPVSSAFGSITSDKGAGERRLTFAVKVMF